MIIFLGKQSWLALASEKANHHCEIIIIAMIIGATNVITFNFSTDTFFMTLSSFFLISLSIFASLEKSTLISNNYFIIASRLLKNKSASNLDTLFL